MTTDLDRNAALLRKLRARKESRTDGEGAAPKRAADEIARADRSGPLPLSFGQERIWLLDRLAPGGNAFNMAFPLRLRGRLDVEALRRAVDALVARHEALRTTFTEIDGEPRQVLHDAPLGELRVVDLSDLSADERQTRAGAIGREEQIAPFDLEKGPLYRACLVILGEDEHELYQTMHHIVSDGWSSGVLFRDLGLFLEAFTKGEEPALEPLPIQYADFVVWQRERLRDETLDKLVSYWREALDGAPQTLTLPTDRTRPAVSKNRGATLGARLSAELTGRLRELAKNERASLFTLLLAAFDLLMARLAGQDDVLVGSPVAGRQRAETEHLVGFFLNTLVLRARVDPAASFRDLLAQVRKTVLGATEHQDVPFEKLLEELRPERHLSQTPLFQVFFNMANLPGLAFELPGLSAEIVDAPVDQSKFDLTLYVFEERAAEGGETGALDLHALYDLELFDRARVEEMLRQYVALLEQIVADPARPVGALDLVTESARGLLPDPTAALDAPWRESVPDAVARHATSTPDSTAVIDSRSGVEISYAELDARSRRVARSLRSNGLEKGDVVVVWAHRSAPLVEALVGILGAGGAFTILDPQYPGARLLDYVDLAKPRGVVALEAAGPMPEDLAEALEAAATGSASGPEAVGPEEARRWVTLPAIGENGPEDEAPADDAPAGNSTDDYVEIDPDDLAYIAFTSGSTGRPKAVLGRHAPLLHLVPFFAEHFDLDATDRHGLLSALSHDPLHRDVFHPLGFGATIVVPDPERVGSPGYLAEWMREEELTVANLVPAMLQLVTSNSEPATEDVALPALRRVFTVGEVLKRHDVDALYRLAPSAVCINLYGATETQRAVGHVVIPRDLLLDPLSERGTGGLGKAAIPVGRGVDATQLLVLASGDRLAGVGEPGEIAVRSPLLARGYADPAATAERFTTNPFTGRAGDRIYRTGDLGSYLPNGDVEYLGRADSQVKIRGFRIELQEIEGALARRADVRECAVVTLEDPATGSYLAAYLVLEEGAPRPAVRDLRSELAETLPDYMVPTAWSVLDVLPKSRTGKIDRRALPAPDRLDDTVEYRPPVTPEQELVAGFWRTILGVERVGLDDHFFELGGHSLLATRLVARVRDAFGVELPLRQVFEHPRLVDLAGVIAAAVREDGAGTLPPLEALPRDGAPFPASFSQQRLWFLDRLEPGSAAYVLSGAVRLAGPLDRAAFAAAVDDLVARHEALRTRIVTSVSEEGADEPVQVVDPPGGDSVLVFEDLEGAEGALEAARRRASEEAQRPFDLATDRLLRLFLLRLGEDDHALVLSIHHVISDGWSLGLFFRELAALYRARATGEPEELPEPTLHFGDYAAWERAWLVGDELERQIDFWRRHLDGAPPVLELPTDRPRTPLHDAAGARLSIELGAETSDAVRRASLETGTTPYMTLLAAWALLLGHHARQGDVVIGTPIAHRPRAELEGVIGFFANTLALRVEIDGATSVADLVARVRRTVLDAFSHQDLPFEKLVAELDVERDLGSSPVFQVTFALLFASETGLDAESFADLALEDLEPADRSAPFDLHLGFFDAGAGTSFTGFFEYATALFDAATVERLGRRYRRLVEQMVEDPARRLDALDFFGDEDARLLAEVNDTARDYPSETLPVELFERWAKETPERPAVAYADGRLTYGELEARAESLANRLVEHGVGPEVLVGVCLERSIDLVVAFLAVWKAGGGYVYLDPAYPKERLEQMVEDTSMPVAITVERLAARVEEASDDVGRLVLDSGDLSDDLTGDSGENRPRRRRALPDNVALVVYTSGSTGRPKGSAVTFRNLVRLIAGLHYFDFSPDDVFLQGATPSFDVSAWEIWAPLAHGASIVGAERDELLDLDELHAKLVREGVTVADFMTALLHQAAQERPSIFSGLRCVTFGGERCEPRWVRAALDAGPGRLLHLYGPTECTTSATWYDVDEVPEGAGSVPIGRPVTNTEILVLDRDGHLCPTGVPGELCLGGPGVVRGYLLRPGLTAEKFVPHPTGEAQDGPGARVYRTGDLVRLLPDGELDFLGRIDRQVKIRGFRVEPGEVEAALAGHPAVAQAIVVVRGDGGDRHLVAYATPEEGESKPDAADLREYLRGEMPAFMQPAAVVVLDAFPLNRHGKVDQRALPVPEVEAAEYRAPSTDEEKIVAEVWQEVLGAETVGLDDEFFALGGHSLLATRVVFRIRERLDVELPLREIFEHPRLESLAAEIAARRRGDVDTDAPKLVAVDRDEVLPASFGQQRLWFLDQMGSEGGAAYNMPSPIRLRGALDADALGRALADLWARHEALRTTLVAVDGEPRQVIASAENAPPLEIEDLSSAEDRHDEARRLAAEDARTRFDLAAGPLVRWRLLRLAADDHVLLLTLHHVITDGVSMDILLAELEQLYVAHREGGTGERADADLPELPIQFADFATWERRWLSGDRLAEQLAYWREHLREAPRSITLPLDHPRPAMRDFRGDVLEIDLGGDRGRDLAARLDAASRELGATPFMVLFAAWAAFLGRWADQDRVVLGTTVAHRQHPELEKVVGFFANTLAIATDLRGDRGGEPSFAELVRRVRDTLLDTFGHQDLPFEKLVAEMAAEHPEERDPSTPPIYQVGFGLQQQGLQQGEATDEDRFADLDAEAFSFGVLQAKEDLRLVFDLGADASIAHLVYDVALFDADTIERAGRRFRRMLERALVDPEAPIVLGDLEEDDRLWAEINAPAGDRTETKVADTTVVAMFEEQVDRAPDRPALVYADARRTYGELDARANRLAHRLVEHGVGPDVLVGVCLPRSARLVETFLAILKADGGYVYLDPSYPAERLGQMIDDTRPPVLVTDSALETTIDEALDTSSGNLDAETRVPRLVLDRDDALADASDERLSTTRPPRRALGDHVAVVVYTSGSTGRAKGSGVTHRNIVRLVQDVDYFGGLGPDDAFLQAATPSFDIAILEIWASLVHGAAVVGVDREQLLDLRALETVIETEAVTVADFTTALLHQVAEERPSILARLRAVLFGGERAEPKWVRAALAAGPGRLLNMYGPTECTTSATFHEVREVPEGARAVPIGRPVPFTEVLVLDRGGERCPIGVPGELCLGGPGVVRGYLDRPRLTAEKFVPHPTGEGLDGAGARLYRTGDLVRLLPSGDLDFLGRIDRQVKIRGFRVEPGEVESTLGSHPSVARAVVVVRGEGSERRLVAYVTPEEGAERPTPESVAEYARGAMPAFLQPSAIVVLDEFPLNRHGKIDQQALPAAERTTAVHRPPRTVEEELVAGLWAEILGLETAGPDATDEPVGLDDEFFALGGHSLLATRVVSRLRDALGVDVPVKLLFEEPGLERFVAAVVALREAEHAVAAPPRLERIERDGPLPASFSQQRLWFLDRMDPGGTAYNLPSPLRVHGGLDADILERALGDLVRRHEVLRTTIVAVDGEPRQVVAPPPESFSLEIVDLREEGSPEAGSIEEAARRIAHDDAETPFDLAAGPLARWRLLRLADDDHVLLVNLHHAITDGLSMDLLFAELETLYALHRDAENGEADAETIAAALPELSVQFVDFAAWERSWLTGEVLEAQLDFWRSHLADAPAVLSMPTDRPRPPMQTFAAGSVRLDLGTDLGARVEATARRLGATPFMVLLGGWAALLGRWAGQERVVLGTPVSYRPYAELEGVLGFFANTLALATDLSGDPTFAELVARTRSSVLDAFGHQALPFEKLVAEMAAESQVERDPSTPPIYQASFVLQQADTSEARFAGLEAEIFDAAPPQAKVDLHLALGLASDSFIGSLVYNADLFDASTIERLGRHFGRLLDALLDAPLADASHATMARVSAIDLRDPEEVDLLARVNDTTTDFPREATPRSLFEETADRLPEKTALVFYDAELSYGEVEARANRLAHLLIARGIGPEAIVGLMLPRSAELVVTMVAVAKAGAAYVYLDPASPAERIEQMLEDTAMPAVVTRGESAEALPAVGPEILRLDQLAETLEATSDQRPDERGSGENVAYVIYTSGSTGRPKGSLVPASAVARLARETPWLQVGEDDVVAQAATPAFDAAAWEIWATLANGASLVEISRDDVVDPARLEARLAGENVTIAFFTTALFQQVARERPSAFVGLRALLFGGERCDPKWVRALRESFDGRLLHMYGPTECTTYATYFEVEEVAENAVSVPIGGPISNTEIHVLDPGGRPCPVGVAGELLIGGPGVTRGYLRRPALTAEKFVPHPTGQGLDGAGARLYRTGDLVRFLASGAIDFLGRVDRQVKLRGYRIEPGEIEAVLAEHPSVAGALVRVVGEGDQRRLVAWAEKAGPGAVGDEILGHLAERLPPFMVPAALVLVDVFPLTPNGKIDHRSLPEPEWSDEAAHREPESPTERLVAEIWADVLGVERVGANDDFFALGGHSLLAARVFARLQEKLSTELPLRLLFDEPRLEDFAAALDERLGTRDLSGRDLSDRDLATIPRVDRSEPLPLSYGQERIWLLERLFPGGNSFNMPSPVRLRGALDVGALERTIATLVERHETLRTTFVEIEGSPRQVIHPVEEALRSTKLETIDLADLPEKERRQRADALREEITAAPFDLEEGPLFRAVLLRLADDEHHLILVVHHIVSDGWSTGVLFGELGRLLTAYSAGESPNLSSLEIQYGDYAAWQRERLSGEYLDQLLAYWRETLADAEPTLALPTDRPRPAASRNRGGTARLGVPAALVEKLQALAQSERASLFMVLLAGFDGLLARLAGQDDILVGSPVAGRQRLETEGLVGFFLNTLVLRTRVEASASFRSLLRDVRATVLGATEHQEIPFEKLLTELRPERHLSQNPFFQVMFNMTNLPLDDPELPGLDAEGLGIGEIGSKFDLTLYVAERPDSEDERLELYTSYDADLFDQARIEEMLRQYVALLEQFADDPERTLGSASMITPAARPLLPDPTEPLSDEWRGSISAAMARHVESTPDAVAVADLAGTTTYAELFERSGQIARRLVEAGVERGDVVAIWAHRSAPLVDALYGVLRAGAAFTILDPAYPDARLADYVRLAAPRAIVVLGGTPAVPDELVVGPRIELPLEEGAAAGEAPDEVDLAPVGADDLAYVAFTSGSTGEPKAILGRHGSLTHFLPFFAERFALDASDRHAMLSALSHDPLHRDVFLPLAYGATIAIPDPERIGEPGYLAEWMAAEHVTVANLVPAMLRLLVTTAAKETALVDLRRVFTVGEVLTRREVESLFALAPNVECVNYYGSTETQRALGFVEVPRDLSHLDPLSDLGTAGHGKAAVPIGRGIDGVQLLVFDAEGRLAGIGEPGEIHVRSHHLARGYVDPEATRERFVTNPFTEREGDRLYKTGDLGRYLPNGDVEFVGRADSQVKIRGFRIELQEIEVALEARPEIAECVVIVHGEGDARRLAAYLVPAAGHAIPAPRELRSALSERLPDYMLPTAWTVLDSLPRTRTGKLDRRSLPAPETVATTVYRAPESPAAKLLAQLWADVLEVDAVGSGVGLDDDFFALGGHSLLATRVLARVRESFGVEVPLRLVFEHPRLEDFAAAVAEIARRDEGLVIPPLEAVARDGDLLPTSFSQQRLWFLDRLAPDNTAYVLSGALRLRGDLDVAALERALGALVERHETLRTRLVTDEAGDPKQEILPPPSAGASRSLPVEDLHQLDEDPLDAARRIATEEADRPIALDDPDGLLRVRLLRLAEDDHALVVSIHHAVADGWSLGILFSEWAALYSREIGAGVDLPPAPGVQFADFAAWERAWLDGEPLDRQLAFWREHLAGAPAALELPTDRPRPAVKQFDGARLDLALDEATSDAVRAACRDAGVTPFMMLFASWALVLSRHAGQDDVVIGIPVAHRPRTELEGVIGFFANTLPLRADLRGEDGSLTGAELLRRIRRSTLDAFSHEDLPFEKLVAELDVERNLSTTPIFQVTFGLQTPEGGPSDFHGLEIEGLEVKYHRAAFDLHLALYDAGAGRPLVGYLQYDVALFEEASAERFADHFRRLLRALAEHPDRPIESLDARSENDVALVAATNATANDFPRDATTAALFEEMTERFGDKTALVFPDPETSEDIETTYAELDAAAERLAHALVDRGVGFDDLVGLRLPRGTDLVVAMVAVAKTGAGSVYLDPEHPRERVEQILEDTAMPVLVTDDGTLPDFLENGPEILRLDRTPSENPAEKPVRERVGAIPPEATAYVIYTSGSTGRPKGTLVPHRAVARLVRETPWLQIESSDVVAQAATPSFDAAAWEIWGALTNGATLVSIERDDLVDPARLEARLVDAGVTVAFFTTALFQQVVRERPSAFDGLRALLFGGERCDPKWVRAAREAFAGRLLHMYGPSECTTYATWFEVEEVAEDAGSVPIGGPVANTEIHVVDRAGLPCPVGVPGELLIGGPGVTRGYLGRPALTAEKFVPHPAPSESLDGAGARLYRTGDRVRWLASGALDFLGRVDRQVKLRGFRIEPGEIEAVLVEHPAVAGAFVRVIGEGEHRRLVAWVETGAGNDEILSHLRERLPTFMVPSALVSVDAFPLTPNGKIDYRSLPEPEADGSGAGPGEYRAPRTPEEELVAGVWAEVLGRERIGLDDDFFALGGHSLLATRVLSRVRDRFGVEVPLAALFEAPRLGDFAAAILDHAKDEAGLAAPPLVRVDRDGEMPASYSQQRLWFIDRLDPDGTAYLISMPLRLHGELDAEALGRALDALVARHEALRTTIYAGADSEPRQRIAEPAPVPLEIEDLSASSDVEAEASRRVAEEHRRRFDLEAGPLVRARLLRLAEDDHVFLLTVHHVISDGGSMDVILRELARLYAAEKATETGGAPADLPPLPFQFVDFAAWENDWLRGDVLQGQLDFWRRHLADAPRVLDLPTDRPRPATQTFGGDAVALPVEREAGADLEDLARRLGATPFMTVLAAWAAVLGRWANQDQVVLGTPVAHRPRLELEGVVGFFANTLALATDLSAGPDGDPSFAELVGRCRRAVLDAFAHQDLPFEKLVAEMDLERDLSISPIFQATFGLQQIDDGGGDFAGLRLGSLGVESRVAKHDLHLDVRLGTGVMAGSITYNVDLFDASTVERMAGHLARLLERASAAPERPVSELLAPVGDELETLLDFARGERFEVPALDPGTIFEQRAAEHAAKNPDQIALDFADATLTWAELHQRARHVAAALEAAGAGPERPVAFLFERSAALVTAVIGATLAGAPFVNLDPEYPESRLEFMFEDSGAVLLVGASALADRAPAGAEPRTLDDLLATPVPEDWRRPPVDPENAACILYTSGSTGRPKGVVVPNRALLDNVLAGDYYAFSPDDVVSQALSPSFDPFNLEVFGALLSGASLAGIDKDTLLDTERLARRMEETGLTFLVIPVALLHQHLGARPDFLAKLRGVLFGGEQANLEAMRSALDAGAPGRLINGYGPTETTITSTFYDLNHLPAEADTVPIGRPGRNQEVHVVGTDGRPAPIGVPGEIVIGGDGVTRGYLGRPDLTAERFVPDPFSEIPGARLYRTGDLGRFLPSGELIFLGRVDHQVKFRGHRLELGEIEEALVLHPGVEAAVARLVGEGDAKRLVAWVELRETAASAPAASTEELTEHLHERLPGYMVPSEIVTLDAFPLTPNGKIDHRALPLPEAKAVEYREPSTPLSRFLAQLWAEVLGADRVGADDGFFALGGHSLLAVKVFARLRETLDLDLPIALIFDHPALEDFAGAVGRQLESSEEGREALAMLEELDALSDEDEAILLDESDPES